LSTSLFREPIWLEYIIIQRTHLEGATDSKALEWAARQNRVFVTHDLKTVPKHAYERVAAGQSMPGVIAIPESLGIGQAIEDMAIVLECAREGETENQILYLPL
jgi:hypothetical protein